MKYAVFLLKSPLSDQTIPNIRGIAKPSFECEGAPKIAPSGLNEWSQENVC